MLRRGKPLGLSERIKHQQLPTSDNLFLSLPLPPVLTLPSFTAVGCFASQPAPDSAWGSCLNEVRIRRKINFISFGL